MVAWGPLQRQLLAYITRHPKFQEAVKKGWQGMAAHSTVQRAKQSAYAALSKMSAKATRSDSESGAKADASAMKRTLDTWRQRISSGWYKYKTSVVSFIAANFMVILMLLQFSPMLWHSAKRCIQYFAEVPSRVEAEHEVRRRGRKAEAAEEALRSKAEAPTEGRGYAIFGSEPPPQPAWGSHAERDAQAPRPSQSWQTSYSLLDDTVGTEQGPDAQQSFNDMHKDLFRTSDGSALVNFDTSFLVKMGDETTFTSSLEREALTGSVSSRPL
ncbi:hypothetical protein LSCM1_04805 [Leishmania martiniquensis]|uniref:Transmembrane protein n=1 Tax=Leishmania martiniquensis TaxID=1580590 RepID=A0A836H1V4_9TRYP|nr:hypothetical protein LSCM1_04805 [Leishmania martiniquensis]